MKPGFIITSAITTKFGVFKTNTRMKQTLDTIISIKERAPNSHITLLEMAGEPLQKEQAETLSQFLDVLIDFSKEDTVQQLYHSTENWDVVKNLTEIQCFGQTLKMILDNHNEYTDIDRFFKLSGRYVLNDDFKIEDYASKYKDKIVFAQRKDSQFDTKITGGVTQQFMSRCWSFPSKDVEKIYKMFIAMRLCMLDILQKGGYLDIEHLLFLYSNSLNILEVDKIGVQGLLGPNGNLVRD